MERGKTTVRIFEHETTTSPELGESHLEHQIKSMRGNTRGTDDDKQDPFMGLNLGVIRQRILWWREHIPEIEPAADCMMISGLTPVIKVLNGSGCWFYALSKKELKDLIDLGADPSRIIFGQTVKQNSHLKYAKENNIGYIAFDSAFELHKIRKEYKEAKLLIRACIVSENKPIPKYGRNSQSCQDILNTARMLGLKVEGVVSVIKEPSDSKDIKETCTMIRNIFQYAEKNLNYNMGIVFVKFNIDRDLTDEDSFIELAGTINRNFLTSFRKMPGGNSKSGGINIIVDPGEYFVKDSVSVAATIIGVRRLGSKDNRKVYYYVNESIFQSFSHVRIKPSEKFVPKVLFYTAKIKSTKGEVEATVYGYSDEENDVIAKGVELPVDMCNGDMLAFYGLGAYVKSFESDWMINNAEVYYFCSTEDTLKIKEWVPTAEVNVENNTMLI